MESGTDPRTVPVDRITSGDHACVGFDDDDALWEVRAAFTEIGLFRGERVMLFTDPGTTENTAVARLVSHGVRVGPALERGQLSVVNDAPGYDPEHGFDPVSRTAAWACITSEAHRRGFSGVRVTGDMSWALEPGVGHEALSSYEVGLTPLFAEIGFTAICEYDRRLFGPELLDDICAAHPVSVLLGLNTLHLAQSGSTLLISGDADLATRDDFDFGLWHAFTSPEGPPRLVDLSRLSFIDAHCASTLVRLAARLAPAAHLTVRCLPSHCRTLRLCGAEQLSQIILETCS